MSPSIMKPDKSYLFFSHVIKAQPANLPLLDKILDHKCRLIDYECITERGEDKAPRLVAFGKYAGIAGMIDALQGLGLRLLVEGYSNPFINVPMSYMFESVHAAKVTLRGIGAQIRSQGLTISDSHAKSTVVYPWTSSLVFAFAGTGNVSKGAREIFEQLPHDYVSIEDLPILAEQVMLGKRPKNRLYGVVFDASDVIRKLDGSPLTETAHYYAHPHEYKSIFHDKVAPYINVLINGMYWDDRYPRLLTKAQLKALRKTGNRNLKVVADISCDIEGGIEFLSHNTTMERPFYSYVPELNKDIDGVDKDGVLVLGLDTLPTELPREASESFGKALMPLLPPLLRSKGSEYPEDLEDLPPELRRACIASHGKLLPKWSYITRLREQASILRTTSVAGPETSNVELELTVSH
jgi:alpha-aminoadipic semialdehyde synthase